MSACTAAVNSRIDTFDNWYTTTKGVVSGVVATPLSTSDQAMLNQKMAEVSETSACLLEKIRAAQGTSTSIHNTQETILTLSERLKKEEENVRIAQDRVRLLRFPNENASYYESWFPLGRPLQPVLVPIFFGLAIFLFTVAGLMLLSMAGVDIYIFLPRGGAAAGGLGGGSWVSRNLRWPFWVTAIALIAVVVYFVRR